MIGQQRYDVIVLGLGAMGSATLYTLAQRGMRVCGIEQHHVAHALGSSHGTLRVIRKAYFEHPDYVPLMERAYHLWRELDSDSSDPLMTISGLIVSGGPASEILSGLESCYLQHDLPHQKMTASEAGERFPKFAFPRDHEIIHDPSGGYLRVEQCVARYIKLAEVMGAEIRLHESALSWEARAAGVRVRTENAELEAATLVLTTGPWMTEVLSELNVELTVKRKVQLWFDSPNIDDYSVPNLPCFAVDLGHGFFYGFPAVDEHGVKVAEHSGGQTVPDPSEVDRALHPEDETRVLSFLEQTLPHMRARRTHFSVCMYTNSPDEHFILDQHPEFANVFIGAGFSGHGFKFAPVVGEILADLAVNGRTSLPADFLKLNRFYA